MKEGSVITAVIGALFIGICIGNIMQIGFQNHFWQRECVKHGAAEWVMDPQNGATTWRWKDELNSK